MSDVKRNIELLFDRPSEPLFLPKGNEKVVFEVSNEYLTEKYQPVGALLSNRFGEEASERVSLGSISPPDLSEIGENALPRDQDFSLFIPKHRRIAALLLDIFMAVPNGDLEGLKDVAAYCRDRVNSQLFNYCLSVAMLHREDTKDIPLPNLAEKFPSKFVDQTVLQEAREVSSIVPENMRTERIVIPKDYTASDLELEHKVAYFREDIGINLHHWHWHLVYPFNANDIAIVRKDRRGELFYYMHQQIMARYDCERLANDLGRVKRFNNFREPIIEGYFPKLDSLTSGRAWPPRQAGLIWQNLNRPIDGFTFSLEQMETWRKNIDDAISSGVVQTAGGQMPLDIDMLGNMLEASQLSPNEELYGNLHNVGHLLTALIHDPDHKYLESVSVMGDSATAMRDPFFYRWHAVIERLFQKFKESSAVQPYRRAELTNPGISITSANISSNGKTNQLQTFWMQSDLDLSSGMDFSARGPVYVRFTHLNHLPFNYNITVNNEGEAKFGTVRIFIAPKFDQRGIAWSLNEHRAMFIELDRFLTQLQPGENIIERKSSESSVTIPFERTFRDLSSQPAAVPQSNFCGCGWPHHMLIPKGKPDGMPFQLFVMVSNYDLDRIDQDTDSIPCNDASSYCGIRDSLYPDRRSMGYPFDRPPNPRFATIQDFVQPNMALTDVSIKFSSKTIPNPKNPK